MIDRLFIAGLLLIMLQGCAKIGRPSGGPQDIHPPEFVDALPENRSLSFTGDRIDITFDEYIQLKDQNKEILISPPMDKKPLVRLREKTIRVTFNEDLLPGTTYTLNFGNAIADLNEGNTLPDFEFVFSTDTVLDSLSLTGRVLQAFNHKPETEPGFMVMLYENLADSAPLIEIPKYHGRANKEGLFAVNNIHADTFRIVALWDENNNRRYDPGLDRFAFLDSLLVISAENVNTQTFIKDTVKIITPAEKPLRGNRQGRELIKADTTIAPGKIVHARNVSLFYFLEEQEKVFLTSRSRESPERLIFTLSRPVYDSLQITPLNFKPEGNWFLKESNRNADTLTYWITDTTLARLDTLVLRLSYLTTDSASNFITRVDTISLRYQLPVSKEAKDPGTRRGKSETTEVKTEFLSLAVSVTNRGTQNLNRPVTITTDKPLKQINPGEIEFYKLVDTVYVKQPFKCVWDTSAFRRFSIDAKWEEDVKYRVLLKPGTAYNIYGLTNDSLEIGFSTQKMDYYGRILLDVSSRVYPLLMQVLDDKEQIIASQVVTAPGMITYAYLPPGRYKLKAIYDENGNGKWDTGHYLKQIQPEKVFLSSTVVQLRSNWDFELTWAITE